MNANFRTNWLIAIALTSVLLYFLAPVLTPFIAAALLAYIGDPLADRLQRLKMPRSLAVLAVFLLTFLMIGLIVLLSARWCELKSERCSRLCPIL